MANNNLDGLGSPEQPIEPPIYIPPRVMMKKFPNKKHLRDLYFVYNISPQKHIRGSLTGQWIWQCCQTTSESSKNTSLLARTGNEKMLIFFKNTIHSTYVRLGNRAVTLEAATSPVAGTNSNASVAMALERPVTKNRHKFYGLQVVPISLPAEPFSGVLFIHKRDASITKPLTFHFESRQLPVRLRVFKDEKLRSLLRKDELFFTLELSRR